jgi:hypothetical protein
MWKKKLLYPRALNSGTVAISTAGTRIRLAPTRSSKGSSTLNIEYRTVLYSLQQRHLNGPLNLEDAVGSFIYRISLNSPLSV